MNKNEIKSTFTTVWTCPACYAVFPDYDDALYCCEPYTQQQCDVCGSLFENINGDCTGCELKAAYGEMNNAQTTT